MQPASIQAYDIAERIASYDGDMELMHPNRGKMVQIALELLPFHSERSFKALDLGIGTGFFTRTVLGTFQNCRVLGLDGAAAMIDMAKRRLGSQGSRVDFLIGDFRQLGTLLPPTEEFDLVYSAYALHHLSGQEKLELLRQAITRLKPGGWLVNADLVVAAQPQMEARIQAIRVEGIVKRAAGRDQRFLDAASTRAFLDDLEKRDEDKPLTLEEDLRILKEAGLKNASAFWLEHREAVTGGFKN